MAPNIASLFINFPEIIRVIIVTVLAGKTMIGLSPKPAAACNILDEKRLSTGESFLRGTERPAKIIAQPILG